MDGTWACRRRAASTLAVISGCGAVRRRAFPGYNVGWSRATGPGWREWVPCVFTSWLLLYKLPERDRNLCIGGRNDGPGLGWKQRERRRAVFGRRFGACRPRRRLDRGPGCRTRRSRRDVVNPFPRGPSSPGRRFPILDELRGHGPGWHGPAGSGCRCPRPWPVGRGRWQHGGSMPRFSLPALGGLPGIAVLCLSCGAGPALAETPPAVPASPAPISRSMTTEPASRPAGAQDSPAGAPPATPDCGCGPSTRPGGAR